jgi:hypothetical protein
VQLMLKAALSATGETDETIFSLTTCRVTIDRCGRNSTAMNLLHAGVDTVIALWLGHESPSTPKLPNPARHCPATRSGRPRELRIQTSLPLAADIVSAWHRIGGRSVDGASEPASEPMWHSFDSEQPGLQVISCSARPRFTLAHIR